MINRFDTAAGHMWAAIAIAAPSAISLRTHSEKLEQFISAGLVPMNLWRWDYWMDGFWSSAPEWQTVFRMSLFKNKWLVGGLLMETLLQAAVIFLPYINDVFHTKPLPLKEALAVGVVASLVLWVEEARRFVWRRTNLRALANIQRHL